MRRVRFLLPSILFATLAISAVAAAQFERPVQRAPRAWLGLSDGFGPSGGGVTGSTGMSQLFRATATVAVTDGFGLEVTGFRIQETFPTQKLLTDPTLNSPRADGIFASFAQISSSGRRGTLPAVSSIGGGVVRRPTNDPTKTRLTGAVQVGVESSLWRPDVTWADAAAGLRLVLMPAGSHRQIYMLALTLGIRVG